MSNRSRTREYAGELRFVKQFIYLVLLAVAEELYHVLGQKKQVPELTIGPAVTDGFGNQFEKYFTQDFLERHTESARYKLDKWLQEGRPAVSEALLGLIPPEYHSDEGWQKFCKNPRIAQRYVLGVEASIAAFEILRAIDYENLPVDVLERLLGLSQGRVSPQLFEGRNAEPRPNHAALSDLLRLLPYPHKWNLLESSVRVEHTQDRYVQFELFGMDSTGDFIPINPETAQSIIGSFDWIDSKIISVFLMLSAQYRGGKFVVSGNWLLKLISDERKVTKGSREYLTHREKMEDLEKRIKRLRTFSLQVQWHVGSGSKKRNLDLKATGDIAQRRELALFLIPDIWYESEGKKLELKTEIIPGKWYELYCTELKEFTWIPKELLEVNVYKHWRRYAILDYVLIIYRINKKKLKTVVFLERTSKENETVKVLHLKLETLLREVLSPEEIEYALSNRDKGWRLKTGMLQDFEVMKEWGWYVDVNYSDGGFSEFMAGYVDIAPQGAIRKLITTKSGSRQPKPAPRKKKEDSPTALTGEQVKQARLAQKIKRKDLADSMQIHPDYLGKLERGDRLITPELEIGFRKYLKL